MHIEGTPITQGISTKFLSVNIDQPISFLERTHPKHLHQNCCIAIFSRTSPIIPPQARKTLQAYCIPSPILQYSLFSICKSSFARFVVLQKNVQSVMWFEFLMGLTPQTYFHSFFNRSDKARSDIREFMLNTLNMAYCSLHSTTSFFTPRTSTLT